MNEFPENSSSIGKSSENPIPLTPGELTILSTFPEDHHEFKEAMERHGLSFDMGDVWVRTDGKIFKISTDRNDFGSAVL